MTKLEIIEQKIYQKSIKKLSKKYPHINKDVLNHLKNITSLDELGIELKKNIFKTRIKNSDKNRGKSSEYRLISYLYKKEDELHLLFIYDKSALTNITENELDNIILKQLKDL